MERDVDKGLVERVTRVQVVDRDGLQGPGGGGQGVSVIEWLAKVWAPLAAYTFALATGYWYEFRHVLAIPASFASGSTVAALPAIAGIVVERDGWSG